ncbi:hypothetical protein G7Y89_g15857 [Cudoniella acicularis]|uniref:Uncharacterized protein n=1 Tax=Cudoniella acicularis TaxID=354080 RepID=A0A8H4QEL5_9HELO|nr:hypothetical protein G7Y89_g15857 [Cudoniella acicularis]
MDPSTLVVLDRAEAIPSPESIAANHAQYPEIPESEELPYLLTPHLFSFANRDEAHHIGSALGVALFRRAKGRGIDTRYAVEFLDRLITNVEFVSKGKGRLRMFCWECQILKKPSGYWSTDSSQDGDDENLSIGKKSGVTTRTEGVGQDQVAGVSQQLGTTKTVGLPIHMDEQAWKETLSLEAKTSIAATFQETKDPGTFQNGRSNMVKNRIQMCEMEGVETSCLNGDTQPAENGSYKEKVISGYQASNTVSATATKEGLLVVSGLKSGSLSAIYQSSQRPATISEEMAEMEKSEVSFVNNVTPTKAESNPAAQSNIDSLEQILIPKVNGKANEYTDMDRARVFKELVVKIGKMGVCEHWGEFEVDFLRYLVDPLKSRLAVRSKSERSKSAIREATSLKQPFA